jgi:ubiquinone/menaquinone biosynthesis C-methylase UbiE
VNAEQNAKKHTERQDLYFEMLAEMDMTKHMGSLDATLRIAELCHIGPQSTVLDVGCGVGYTPIYLARKLGCKVVGIDLYESMVERARARVRREGMEERVEIRQGDMVNLPFDDGQFDAVMAESVVAFAPDKARALAEFARVLVPGGYVGFTEATWNREPSPKALARVPTIFGENYETYKVDGWRALIEAAGFEHVVAEAHPVRIKREARGRMERIGCRNMLGVLRRFAVMIVNKPQIRSLYGSALNEPKELVTAWDYGIYAGRKPK